MPRVRRVVPLLIAVLALALPARARAADEAPAKTYTIGAIHSETGRFSEVAKMVRDGYRLAIDTINAAGGITVDGTRYRLALETADDGSTADGVRRAARRLVNEADVDALLGPYGAALTSAAVPVAEKAGIPLVAGNGSGDLLFEADPRYLFSIPTATDRYLAGVIDMVGRHALAHGRDPAHLRIALAFKTDAGTADVRAGVVRAIRRWGMEIVVDADLPASPRPGDMAAIVERVRKKRPDAFLVSGHDKGGLLAVRRMAATDTYVPMLAVTHCEAADLIEKTGKAAAYTVCATQWDRFMPYSDRRFNTANEYAFLFKERFGYEPPYQAAQSTAAVLVLARAVERAGSPAPRAVRGALARTDTSTVFGPVRFRDGRNTAHPMLFYQVRDGAYRVVGPGRWAWADLVYPAPPDDPPF